MGYREYYSMSPALDTIDYSATAPEGLIATATIKYLVHDIRTKQRRFAYLLDPNVDHLSFIYCLDQVAAAHGLRKMEPELTPERCRPDWAARYIQQLQIEKQERRRASRAKARGRVEE